VDSRRRSGRKFVILDGMPEHRSESVSAWAFGFALAVVGLSVAAIAVGARGDTDTQYTASAGRPSNTDWPSPRATSTGPTREGNSGPPSSSLGAPERASRPAQWIAEFCRLDRARAAAWRTGLPTALRSVYVQGSAALRVDMAALASYRQRGLIVRGVDIRLLSLRLLRHRAGRVWLDVVDQLGNAMAIDRAGRERALPNDRPTRHQIELQRVAGEWRIAAVVSS
jgi:hypothetical protein